MGNNALKVREMSLWPEETPVQLPDRRSERHWLHITTTEVPLSKAINPDCSRGAAQWPANHTEVVLSRWMCNCGNIIRTEYIYILSTTSVWSAGDWAVGVKDLAQGHLSAVWIWMEYWIFSLSETHSLSIKHCVLCSLLSVNLFFLLCFLI